MAENAPDLTAGVSLADLGEDDLLAGAVRGDDVLLRSWTDDADRRQVALPAPRAPTMVCSGGEVEIGPPRLAKPDELIDVDHRLGWPAGAPRRRL